MVPCALFSDIMSAFTCITCRVVFVDGDTQREHYKTDWHRYNLKRKIAQLAPVTADNFKLRVQNAQESPVGTPEPLYNTHRYNTVLDITQISAGPQIVILD